MKQFTIKYMTYGGQLKVAAVTAYNKIEAVRKLTNCREVLD